MFNSDLDTHDVDPGQWSRLLEFARTLWIPKGQSTLLLLVSGPTVLRAIHSVSGALEGLSLSDRSALGFLRTATQSDVAILVDVSGLPDPLRESGGADLLDPLCFLHHLPRMPSLIQELGHSIFLDPPSYQTKSLELLGRMPSVVSMVLPLSGTCFFVLRKAGVCWASLLIRLANRQIGHIATWPESSWPESSTSLADLHQRVKDALAREGYLVSSGMSVETEWVESQSSHLEPQELLVTGMAEGQMIVDPMPFRMALALGALRAFRAFGSLAKEKDGSCGLGSD